MAALPGLWTVGDSTNTLAASSGISFRPIVYGSAAEREGSQITYGATFTPYTRGMNGWVPMVQSVIAFDDQPLHSFSPTG